MLEQSPGQHSFLIHALVASVGAMLLQGCALHREGTREVAATLERHAATRARLGDVYARAPQPRVNASAPAGGAAELRTLADLRDFIVLALERNPEILAAAEAAQAKSERIIQATTLPDPMLTTRTLPEPVRTAEGDNYFTLAVSERLPIPQKLERAGRVALEETRAALHHLQEVRIRVIAEVKRAYFQVYVLDRSIEITQENQRLLRGLIDVARAQVTSGRRPQDDVLRAQVELSNLEAELIALRQRRWTAAARLNEILDLTPGTPVPLVERFDVRLAELRLEELLAHAAESNPGLRRLRREIQRDAHAVELARLAYWPDFTVGFEWMYMEPRDAFRPPRDPNTGKRPAVSKMSEEGTDNWAIMFGFTLPIWFDKIKGGINESEHRLRATRRQYAAQRNRVEFQVDDALERIRAQRGLALLFRSTIIPQAQQTYEVSLASYIAGSTDFLYVIDNWRKWLVFTIQYHRSLGELERSVADVEEAVGLSTPADGE
jgi:outer membrane protein TolC